MTHLSKRHDDWQVKQADTALRLYDYFLSREMKATAEGMHAAAGEWKMLEEKMREKLNRLRIGRFVGRAFRFQGSSSMVNTGR